MSTNESQIQWLEMLQTRRTRKPLGPTTTKTKAVNFRTRNAQVKREKMLSRLLSATMEVCADTNRRGTAVIDDVVRAAGVSRGAFYWYFDTLDEAIETLGRRLADEISEAGGDAVVWVAHTASRVVERALAARMAVSTGEEYASVAAAAQAACVEPDAVRRRTLARLGRELGRIAARDHFPPPERELAHDAVRALGERMVGSP